MTESVSHPVPPSVPSADPETAKTETQTEVSLSYPTNGAGSPATVQAPHHVSDDALSQLSRQLEYYFSTVNLSRDTYLRTLRELNDGYVPAAILANFAKVQMICPHDSYYAVIKAATDYSHNLEVVFVDKETSRKVANEGPHTLVAIGPRGLKPIELPTTPTNSRVVIASRDFFPTTTTSHTTGTTTLPEDTTLTTTTIATTRTTTTAIDAATDSAILIPPQPPILLPVQNTIILREVPENVTEEDIRQLFDFEKCPPIQQVVEDISRFWFVTLSTSSRDDMVDVMLGLRSKSLKGEPLKARLKSGAIVSPIDAGANTYDNSHLQHPQIYAGDRNLAYDPYNGKKSLSKSTLFMGHDQKKKMTNPNPLQVTTTTTANISTASPRDGKRGNRRNNRKNKKDTAPTAVRDAVHLVPPPPPLIESQFPALEPLSRTVVDPMQEPTTTKTFKTAKEDDDEEKPISSSDGASTATTSTSSSAVGDGPKPKATGGYAAALLKPPPANPLTDKKALSPKDTEAAANGAKNDQKPPTNGVKKTGVPKEVETDKEKEKSTVIETVAPMAWGGGRSFADVLKEDEKMLNTNPCRPPPLGLELER